MENNAKLTLVLQSCGSHVGEVGRKTVLKDDDDTPLYVGDLVECTHYSGDKTFCNFVCHDDEDEDYILGIALSSSSKDYRGEQPPIYGWSVKKVRDYSELKAGTTEKPEPGGTLVSIVNIKS